VGARPTAGGLEIDRIAPTAGGLEIDRIALCWPGSAAVDDLDMRPADGRPDRRWRGPRRAKLAGS
jgi:hypothetical protein